MGGGHVGLLQDFRQSREERGFTLGGIAGLEGIEGIGQGRFPVFLKYHASQRLRRL
jgi:hypothetical protein